jgi:tRNA (guanine-N7-)-methyltransferase
VEATALNIAKPLIHDLSSILERLEPANLFPKAQSIEVELGCGDASFLTEYAHQNPTKNFIGVERLMGRVNKVDCKGRRLGLTNLCGIRIESAYFLEFLLPYHSATALHIYFPDPWPKKKHRRFRLINERFTTLAYQALVPSGIVYLRTDDEDYFQQMTEVFSADKRFKSVETPPNLAAVVTDFERDFNAQGIPTNHAAYQRD